MQKRPIVIALSIAGIIAGTHAGIAAINNESTVSALPAVPVETQAVTDAQMPGDAVAVAQTPAPVEAQPPAEGTAQKQSQPAPTTANETMRSAANTRDDEYHVRLPFTNRQIKVTVPTFPQNSEEFAGPAPSVVAYFDRRNANTQLAGAASPVFPVGGDEFAQPQPSVVAYFDRMAARQLAAATPAAPAVPVAPAPTVAATEVSTVAMTVPSAVKTPGN
jgi:hypothetical protein